MKDFDFTKITNNLAKAAAMSADELAAKKGEDDPFVKIKRNNARLDGCTGHDFEPDPDWRSQPWKATGRTVHCRRCGGDMKMNDAMCYLRGLAHGTGRDFQAMVAGIWPPTPEAHR